MDPGQENKRGPHPFGYVTIVPITMRDGGKCRHFRLPAGALFASRHSTNNFPLSTPPA